VENDVGIICACLPSLAPLKKTLLFEKLIPSSLQYLLHKSGYAKYSSRDTSSKGSSKRMGYQRSESGVELVDGVKIEGNHHGKTDAEVFYTKHRDASDRV